MFTWFMPNPKQQYFLAAGIPLSGGKIYTFAAGTNTPKQTFTDAAGTIPQANPIILNSRGEPASAIRWAGNYKVEVRDALNNLIYTVDDYNSDPSGAGSILTTLSSSVGSSLIGFIQAGVGAVLRTLQSKERDVVNTADYGILMDGSDETTKFQSILNFIQGANAPKKLVIGYGQTGETLISAQLNINLAGGITIEWENSNITLKKRFNGSVFFVSKGLVKFVNPGIDGGGDLGFTGSAIRFADITSFNFDCCIDTPRIRNTQDSCIIFNGPRGGTGIEIRGGSLIPYNPTGVSGAGPAAIRLSGPADNDATPRKITDVDSSSSPLIDLTGMQTTFIKGGQCATMFFDGNIDVTGATFQSAKAAVTGVRIRDGINIAGQDHTFSANSSGGFSPGQVIWGWIFKSTATNCRAGSSNDVLNKITDTAPPQGDNCNQFSSDRVAYNLAWTTAGVQPVIGNGSITAFYSVKGREVTVNAFIQFGATTTFGTGGWEFSVPFPILALTGQGTARLFQGGGGVQMGIAVTTSTGSPSKFKITPTTSTTGVECDATTPFVWSNVGFLQIQFIYLRQ